MLSVCLGGRPRAPSSPPWTTLEVWWAGPAGPAASPEARGGRAGGRSDKPTHAPAPALLSHVHSLVWKLKNGGRAESQKDCTWLEGQGPESALCPNVLISTPAVPPERFLGRLLFLFLLSLSQLRVSSSPRL